MPAPRRLTAVLIGGAVALTPALLTAVPAEAATASVALVGDLQSEVGSRVTGTRPAPRAS